VKEAVQLRRLIRRYRWASTRPEKRKFLRKSQLWSQEFKAKVICNAEFWIERLPRLIGLVEAKEKRRPPVAAAESNGCTVLFFPSATADSKIDTPRAALGISVGWPGFDCFVR
jgi:hypothetical protein